MDLDEALMGYILSQPNITALIDRRFYYDDLPQDVTYPMVVCIEISDVKEHTHSGQSALESPIKQFTIYAKTRAEAKKVAKEFKKVLSDYKGMMSGIEVQYIKLLNELTSKKKNTEGTITCCMTDLEYQINFIRSE